MRSLLWLLGQLQGCGKALQVRLGGRRSKAAKTTFETLYKPALKMLYTSRDSDLTLWETPEFLLTQRHLLTHAWPSENKYVGHHDVIS